VRDSTPDLHALPPAVFHEHVHSFEFWLGSVQGYLTGRPYGHHEQLPEPAFADAERERLITALCHYCQGETMAARYASIKSTARSPQSTANLSDSFVDKSAEALVAEIYPKGVSQETPWEILVKTRRRKGPLNEDVVVQ
jgi:hypothetical protein